MTLSSNRPTPINVNIVYESRRTLTLKARPGTLIVKAPHGVGELQIANFIARHQAWIEKNCVQTSPSYLILGEEINWLLPSCHGHALAPTSNDEDRKKIHRRLCHAILPVIFESTITRLARPRVPLRICSMASAWGKCHSTGRIELHWKVATLPLRLAEYVVCHEIGHLTHFDHTQAFWAHVGLLDPLARKHDRELNAWKL